MEKTRYKSLHQELKTVMDASARYKTTLDGIEARKSGFLEEKQGLLIKKEVMEGRVDEAYLDPES
jgi:hypothetical protein